MAEARFASQSIQGVHRTPQTTPQNATSTWNLIELLILDENKEDSHSSCTLLYNFKFGRGESSTEKGYMRPPPIAGYLGILSTDFLDGHSLGQAFYECVMMNNCLVSNLHDHSSGYFHE